MATGASGVAERDSIAGMLARAFIDDPAMVWIFPDPAQRARRLPRLFALLYDSDLRGGVALATVGGEAATLWRAPGRSAIGWGEMLANGAPLLRALGGNVLRALRLSSAIDAHRPDGAFWYLHFAGCDPAHQGQGHGGAAIRAGLDLIPPSIPTYLETATEGNLGLYQRFGFAVTHEWRVPGGGPRFWSMLRPG
jgi:ribosomal protein S18 acetylase RimI-like enzyme